MQIKIEHNPTLDVWMIYQEGSRGGKKQIIWVTREAEAREIHQRLQALAAEGLLA
jgi:hypothetical protein